jgi:hypothetical protein
MLKVLHPVAGLTGFVVILAFWLSTVLSELFGTADIVVVVKTTIPWFFLLLVPALALAGATGARMTGARMPGASPSPRIAVKQLRMKIVAGNGLLVLMPAAFYLSYLASHAEFAGTFYAVQIVELLAGAINLTLLGLNIRDGLRLSGRLR